MSDMPATPLDVPATPLSPSELSRREQPHAGGAGGEGEKAGGGVSVSRLKRLPSGDSSDKAAWPPVKDYHTTRVVREPLKTRFVPIGSQPAADHIAQQSAQHAAPAYPSERLFVGEPVQAQAPGARGQTPEGERGQTSQDTPPAPPCISGKQAPTSATAATVEHTAPASISEGDAVDTGLASLSGSPNSSSDLSHWLVGHVPTLEQRMQRLESAFNTPLTVW